MTRILVESTGQRQVAKNVARGVREAGATPQIYHYTDIAGGRYALPSRDLLSLVVEAHAQGFDGMVLVGTSNRAIAGYLLAAARLGLPIILLPAGTRGDSTMQVLVEALGLAPRTSALAPFNHTKTLAVEAGERITRLVGESISPTRFLTLDSLENGAMIHAAIGGCTDAVLHLLALAHEAQVPFHLDHFNPVNDRTPFIVDTRPTGPYPPERLWKAGGAQRIIHEIRENLHLDTPTITRETLG